MAARLRRLPRSMTDAGSAAWHPVPEARRAGLGPHFAAHAASIEGRGERRDRKRHMTAASDVYEAQAGLQRARSQARTHTHTNTSRMHKKWTQGPRAHGQPAGAHSGLRRCSQYIFSFARLAPAQRRGSNVQRSAWKLRGACAWGNPPPPACYLERRTVHQPCHAQQVGPSKLYAPPPRFLDAQNDHGRPAVTDPSRTPPP